MSLEEKIKRRNKGRKTVKAGTAAIAAGSVAATGILTAGIASQYMQEAPIEQAASTPTADIATTVVKKKKTPKPPKVAPKPAKTQAASNQQNNSSSSSQKPAKTNGS